MSPDQLRQCRLCGRQETEVAFSRAGYCVDCNRRRASEWQKENKERANARKRAWRRSHPEAQRLRRAANPGLASREALAWQARNPERFRAIYAAHNAVAQALKDGRLSRPDTCQSCGNGAFVEAAHEDYGRPLDVRWLCRPCHRRWDYHDPKTRRSF